MTRKLGLAVLGFGLVTCTQRSAPSTPDAAREPAHAEPPAPSAALSTPSGGRIRPSALAGTWYPAERSLVEVELVRMFRTASGAPTLPGKPLALVVPHAGWAFSGEAAAAAYRTLHRGDFRRVVVVGPSHEGGFSGFALSDADRHVTPLGEVPVCPEGRELSLAVYAAHDFSFSYRQRGHRPECCGTSIGDAQAAQR